jgi:putative ubiquitin-RnfH superfamily antitoxin RatB of RatAB toxin-antitoxin module
MSTIEIIYPTLKTQEPYYIKFKNNLTIEEAIEMSGILKKHKEIDLNINHVGIFNQVKKLTDKVNAGDRIEIYRDLIANPKEVRRKRAQKQKEAGVIK